MHWLFRRVAVTRVDALAVLAFVLLVLVALSGISKRLLDLERSAFILENKPCLMMGAHTGCEEMR